MCLFTTTPRHHHDYVVRPINRSPPRHVSHYSAHPPAGTVRLPRGSTTSYREYTRRSSASLDDPHVVEYRRSRSRSRPREIAYYDDGARTSRRSVSVVRERDFRDSRGSFGGRGEEFESRRRSVSFDDSTVDDESTCRVFEDMNDLFFPDRKSTS
ncbi:hypothetical protein BU24DRAFT_415880 [Aaosphaeria arxii CBS 175.79]|uniref:Uncharacterized protein n=1 Tax=Aaosphaeria arxii CBS 175.79 TaxID=1450172 RepID=A0A6A5X6M1_9PLEO|nr:uncharacterized protein BU24DRAFT_415880 [Aaosphaeria arxii CBS 175.79]KAF2008526.1 hypothetical protein BU24DRAFT_415880 [Aaosphaeria arxii CBS 175.79]